MKLIFITVFAFIISFSNANGQKVDSPSLTAKIKAEITRFFIKVGYLDKDVVKDSLNFVFATEIKENKILGYQANGIYRIGVLQSHSKNHILIKTGRHFRIFNIDEIHRTLKEVINYSDKIKLPTDSMFYYLKEVMSIYKSNFDASSWTSGNGLDFRLGD